MRNNLWDDPRVSRLCDLTGALEAPVIGGLYWLWASADEHTENGFLPGLTVTGIDRKTGVKGLGAALTAVQWLQEEEGGVTILNFEEHNGSSAKRRCVEAKRKADARKPSASDADNLRTEDGQIPPSCVAREEKNREEDKYISVARGDLPNSQPQEVVDLYHEVLAELPRVRLMDDKRKKAIGTFWRWVLTSEKDDGTRRAQTADQALTWIRAYFERARDNDFLMGRTGRIGEHAKWQCDLDFLLTDKGKKHVIEKTKETA